MTRNPLVVAGAESSGPQAGRQGMLMLEYGSARKKLKVILSNLGLAERRNLRKEQVMKRQVMHPSFLSPGSMHFPIVYKAKSHKTQARQGQLAAPINTSSILRYVRTQVPHLQLHALS